MRVSTTKYNAHLQYISAHRVTHTMVCVVDHEYKGMYVVFEMNKKPFGAIPKTVDFHL